MGTVGFVHKNVHLHTSFEALNIGDKTEEVMHRLSWRKPVKCSQEDTGPNMVVGWL